jgi:predicted esterase YcpF (UPF0227 family)
MATEKNYSNLMKGKKILYVHGFASSGMSGTATHLRNLLTEATVVAPDLPIHPEEALALLKQICEAEKPDLIIGSSMGGMYTEMLRGYDRILVNPAFQMGDTMTKHGMVGKQTFLNPRKDGVQEFIVTKAMVKEYKDMTERCFIGITDDERERVTGLFGDEDPIVHTFDLFHSHYPRAIHFHGEHRLNDKIMMHSVIPVIRWIDDRQNHTDRHSIFISFDALCDEHGNARSSMHKAYELLLENYDIYIVAAAPTNDHSYPTKVQEWVENFINVPAYDRIVFTNQKEKIYGDYLIDTVPQKEFMGTAIQLGSDEFKTWEQVITFFERVGGQ